MAPPTDHPGQRGSSPATEPEAEVVQDPRIWERRAQVLQEETRRRRKRWRWVAVPVLVVVLLVVVAHTPPLSVSEVRVEGAEKTPDDLVLEAARIRTGSAMLTLDVQAAEGRVAELPWVGEVDVVRGWPDTVRIEVAERTPVAVAQGSDSQALVDASGRVLEPASGTEDGLIVLTGVDELPAAGEDLPAEADDALAIAERVPDRVPGALAEISVDLDAVIAEGVAGQGAVVSFRTGESIDERLVALDTLLKGADMSCVATVDLWIPDRPVTTQRPDC